MVVTDLGGRVVEGDLRPSSDLRTIWRCIGNFERWAGLSIPTRITRQSGHKHVARFRVLALPIPTTSTDRFR